MKRRLIIIGASGHGKVVADAAQKMNRYDDILFLDDDERLTECGGFPIVGTCKDAGRYLEEADFFVAIGNAGTRKRIQENLKEAGAFVPTIIHPDAVVGIGAVIGAGTVVMAGAVINAFAQIGKGCIINTCSSVDHDCRIGDFVHVAVGAHLAGTVTVGNGTWIGIGAVVSNNIEITSDCVIGAGAVVVRDITESGTYVGVPAKSLKFSDNDKLEGVMHRYESADISQ